MTSLWKHRDGNSPAEIHCTDAQAQWYFILLSMFEGVLCVYLPHCNSYLSLFLYLNAFGGKGKPFLRPFLSHMDTRSNAVTSWILMGLPCFLLVNRLRTLRRPILLESKQKWNNKPDTHIYIYMYMNVMLYVSGHNYHVPSIPGFNWYNNLIYSTEEWLNAGGEASISINRPFLNRNRALP
jgi:hypothetical protein